MGFAYQGAARPLPTWIGHDRCSYACAPMRGECRALLGLGIGRIRTCESATHSLRGS